MAKVTRVPVSHPAVQIVLSYTEAQRLLLSLEAGGRLRCPPVCEDGGSLGDKIAASGVPMYGEDDSQTIRN